MTTDREDPDRAAAPAAAVTASPEPVDERPPQGDVAEMFPPTLREVMLRARWLAMLALCLVVAAVFAWLGQWQLSRAVDISPPPPGMTEQVRPLADVAEPGAYLPEPLVGQRVELEGSWVADDFVVVSGRYQEGVEGFWVTGQFRVSDPAATGPVSLAVAIGWSPTRAEADAAATRLGDEVRYATSALSGRLISDEGPALPPGGADPLDSTRMSPAALLSQWSDTTDLSVYRPYLVADGVAGFTGIPQIEAIDSPAPAEGSNVNWLNIFYAAEWAVFAGFAFYLWYRLAKDAWEKELEDLADAESEPTTS
jgi:surfeit locus 1 family protein